MREFPFLLFLLSKRNGLQSSEIHFQTDRKWIFNMPYLGFKRMENGSSVSTACLKISAVLRYLNEVLKYSCICFSCQKWPYWMISYVVPGERYCVLLLRKTCPDRGVTDNLLHSVQDSALCPWSRLLSRDRQLQDVSWKRWAHRLWDWQQTCPRVVTFGIKTRSPLH